MKKAVEVEWFVSNGEPRYVAVGRDDAGADRLHDALIAFEDGTLALRAECIDGNADALRRITHAWIPRLAEPFHGAISEPRLSTHASASMPN